jgi:hypothetical protein
MPPAGSTTRRAPYPQVRAVAHPGPEGGDVVTPTARVDSTIAADLTPTPPRQEHELNEHDCTNAATLEFVATYAAPGTGQAWRCTTCGQSWSRIGDAFFPAEDMAHLMSQEDTR